MAASVVAVAAVVGGHALVYEVGPTAHLQTHALTEAGHGHWPLPWLAASLLAAVGASAYGFTRGRRRGRSSWGALWPRLAAGQVSGFLLLEAGERVAAGTAVSALFDEPVILVGIIVQVAAACFAAGVLRTSERVADGFAHAGSPVRLPSVVAVGRRPAPSLRSSRPDRTGLTRRGPPVH
ncbi:MAG TPA: hypothetical protein VM324_08095 [Egibacteraceae bacterium]|nr:hypothetical protein [Egibacteraceae bacterium]